MNGSERKNPDMDDLLKTVLRDDLSLDVEVRMRERIAAFGRSEKRRGSQRGTGSGWLTPAFRKVALAFSSVAAILVGGLMHLGGNRSALAESFTTLNVLFSVSVEIRAAGTMDGEADYRADDGTSLTYTIRWRSSETTRVEVRRAGAVAKTLDISSPGIMFADPARKTAGPDEDPLIRPVMDLLSGEVLAERLNSHWRLIGREQLCGEEDLFHFADRERGILVDLGVDPGTRRPASMRVFEPDSAAGRPDNRPVLSVRFHWNQQSGP